MMGKDGSQLVRDHRPTAQSFFRTTIVQAAIQKFENITLRKR